MTPACLHASTEPTQQVLNEKKKKTQTGKRKEQILTLISASTAPDENPTNVQGIGTGPGNLVITWTVRPFHWFNVVHAVSWSWNTNSKAVLSSQQLDGLQSNGPGLEYKVQWRQRDTGEDWLSQNVANDSTFTVTGTPTFVPYEIKVQAFNDYGSGPDPEVVIGYSGEDCEWNCFYWRISSFFFLFCL